MGKLPGVEDPGQNEGTRSERALHTGRPAHEGRDGPHHRASPGVEDADTLEGRVDGRVEEDVGQAEAGCQGVDQPPEEQGPTHTTRGAKQDCVVRTEGGREGGGRGRESNTVNVDGITLPPNQDIANA